MGNNKAAVNLCSLILVFDELAYTKVCWKLWIFESTTTVPKSMTLYTWAKCCKCYWQWVRCSWRGCSRWCWRRACQRPNTPRTWSSCCWHGSGCSASVPTPRSPPDRCLTPCAPPADCSPPSVNNTVWNMRRLWYTVLGDTLARLCLRPRSLATVNRTNSLRLSVSDWCLPIYVSLNYT